MSRGIVNYPKTIGLRVTNEDAQKLQQLCAETQFTPAEVLRTLLRLAQPTNLPQFNFIQSNDKEDTDDRMV